MKNKIILLLLAVSSFASAQITGPEQDCIGAILVCQPVFVQTNSYQGVGLVNDLAQDTSCLQNDENNSVWYIFEVATSGTIEFIIIPYQPGDDYDFILYDITGKTCANILSGMPNVRCNYAFTPDTTGLKAGFITTSGGPGDGPFLAPLNVTAGQRFALMVDNFSSTQSGYTLDFSASTAVLADPNGTAIQSVSNSYCPDDSVIIVNFSNGIQCGSIASDGSDFALSGPSAITITGASGIGCSNENLTQIAILHYSGQLISDSNYTLTLQQGTDGDVLTAFCGTVIQMPTHFTIQDSSSNSTTADFRYVANGKRVHLYQTATNAYAFTWDLGTGSLQTGNGVIHNYSFGGAKNVCLIAEGLCDKDTICKQIFIETNEVSGKVYYDVNENCTFGSTDVPLKNRIIKTQPQGVHAMTDGNGNYSFVTNPGNFTVNQVVSAYDSWWLNQLCPANYAGHQISFTLPYQDTSGINFADTAMNCPFLTLQISAQNRRMCAASSTSIKYCNDGFAVATNVQIIVTYPPHINLTGANQPYQQAVTKTYLFNIGTFQPQECRTLQLSDFVTCDNAAFNLTQCVEATITSSEVACIPPNPNWSGADITVDGTCDTNGTATLLIINSGSGNMTDSSTFRVYLDSLQVLTQKFKLNSLDTLQIQFAPSGKTVRIEAEQVPFHPRNEEVSLTLEGCTKFGTASVSVGFVNQFPPNDNGPEYAQTCGVLRNSFDPNDKQAVPAGVSENHYILPGTKVDYTIRFQNTGNDTAYNVMILDTLSPHLDLSTFQVGASSHEFEVNMTGEGIPVLIFYFNNIYLPDSATDNSGSQGYISFTIATHDTTPVFTQVENAADIYFDLNPPIRTNAVFHIVSNTKFISAEELDSVTISYSPYTGIREIFNEIGLHLFPNPTNGKLTVQLDYNGANPVRAEVFDMFGKLAHFETIQIRGKQAELNFDAIAKGVYVLRLSNQDFVAARKFTLLR